MLREYIRKDDSGYVIGKMTSTKTTLEVKNIFFTQTAMCAIWFYVVLYCADGESDISAGDTHMKG